MATKFYVDKDRMRNFCFAHFGDEPQWDEKVMTYLVYQLEKCPSTEKLHYQGYCELRNQRTPKGVAKYFPGKEVKCQVRKGTAQQAAAYCKKEESREEMFKEYGSISEQGKRTDIEAVTNEIKKNVSMRQIASSYAPQFVKYHRGFRELSRVVHRPPKRDSIHIVYIWGPPRTGKSKYAFETYPDAYTYLDNSNGWFDGYEGETTVIMDEFSGLTPRNLMLRICDRYPIQVPVKGSFVNFCATTIIITSNEDPARMYDSAFFGRLNDFGEIIYMGAGDS